MSPITSQILVWIEVTFLMDLCRNIFSSIQVPQRDSRQLSSTTLFRGAGTPHCLPQQHTVRSVRHRHGFGSRVMRITWAEVACSSRTCTPPPRTLVRQSHPPRVPRTSRHPMQRQSPRPASRRGPRNPAQLLVSVNSIVQHKRSTVVMRAGETGSERGTEGA